MSALAGKHALVTGGSHGIGAAVAAALLQQGAQVTLLARNETTLQESAVRLGRWGNVVYVLADVSKPEQVEAAFAAARSARGPIELLINNAGLAESAPFSETDIALWQRMLDVNLNGTFYCTRAALPSMRESGWGRIVNVASTAGLQGYPYVAAYCAAKHGVVGLTRALALELVNSGITVNAVCPGYTDTPMLQQSLQSLAARTGQREDVLRAALAAQNSCGRLWLPEEVAQKVMQFCLPEAAGFNGEVASLDDVMSA